MVQLREKDLPTRDLLNLATRVRRAVTPPALFLVNGRADVAFAVGADGVHLPANGIPVDRMRRMMSSGRLVGRSVHTPTEIRDTDAASVNYLEIGTVFPSRSHPGGATIGLQGVREATQYGVPMLAVGGITPENAATVMEAGAAGVAVISAILGASDPARAASELATAVREGWRRTGRAQPGLTVAGPCAPAALELRERGTPCT
jgi:thiamine-phosphate diphosphorylase